MNSTGYVSNMYVYVNACIHALTINEKRVCEFEGRQGVVCVRVWKKEKERGNGEINLQSQKNAEFI